MREFSLMLRFNTPAALAVRLPFSAPNPLAGWSQVGYNKQVPPAPACATTSPAPPAARTARFASGDCLLNARTFQIGTATVVALVALRLGIGWLFFAGAWEKHQNRKFTSEPFLKQAKGPLAHLYQAGVPDVHDFRRFVEQPRKQVPPPESKSDDPDDAREATMEAAAEAAQLKAEPYKQWQEQIVRDWGRTLQAVSSHFGFDDEQKSKAAKLLQYYEGKLDSYLSARGNDLAAFRHDLFLEQPEQQRKRFLPEPVINENKDQRRAKALEVRKWVADTGEQLRAELVSLATEPQHKSYGEMEIPRTSLEKFDRFLIYTHMAIGFCLLVGLLTRLASFGAAAFLLTVVASQPPWVEGSLSWVSGPQAVMYQVILMLACIVLMTSGAGRWAGLDYFFCNWRQLGSQKEST